MLLANANSETIIYNCTSFMKKGDATYKSATFSLISWYSSPLLHQLQHHTISCMTSHVSYINTATNSVQNHDYGGCAFSVIT